jgi:hypothetical protein
MAAKSRAEENSTIDQWYLTLRDDCKLKIFENNETLYRSPNIVSVIKSGSRRAGHVARMEEGWSAFKLLTGKPTGNRHLERPRRRWEDNIRMYLK